MEIDRSQRYSGVWRQRMHCNLAGISTESRRSERNERMQSSDKKTKMENERAGKGMERDKIGGVAET